MRLCMQWTRVTVILGVSLEPGLGMECLCLHPISSYPSVSWNLANTDLDHVLEEFLATPTLQSPIIVILLTTTNAEGAIAAAATP